jgi:hypothetical protein
MDHPIIVSYDSASPMERAFVKELIDYLGTKNIKAIPADPNVSETEMKQRLLNAKWLVLVLTPQALKSPRVQSLVKAAFVRVKQGLMQGVLALAYSSNLVDLEAMPSPSWSTIRIYYTGERNEDHQQAFEKLSRTLGYTRVPVPAASSSTNNWASTYSSTAPTLHQPTRSSHSRLVVPVVAAMILIIFSLAYFLVSPWIFKGPTTSTPTPDVKADQVAKKGPKAPTLPPQDLYNQVTSKKPNFSMDTQDTSQEWGWNLTSPCTFSDGIYKISNGIPDQYTFCMAHNKILKNFAYRVKMTISSSGDSGGLIFRADDSPMIFYRLSLNSHGMYKLYLCQTCTDSSASGGDVLKHGNVNINTIGNPNTLTVIVLNTAIYLYINNTHVIKLDGSAIPTSGEIGLYAVLQDQFTNVSFSEVNVWVLPDSGQLR